MTESINVDGPQLNGDFTCDFCSHAFAQQRYHIYLGDDKEPAWFCLPECMAAYDWYCHGWSVASLAQQNNRKKYYIKTFGRTVVPAPKMTYYTFDETREQRQEWLATCRQELTADEIIIAARELECNTDSRAVAGLDTTHYVIPDDTIIAKPSLDLTPSEREAETLPADDLFDMISDQFDDLSVV